MVLDIVVQNDAADLHFMALQSRSATRSLRLVIKYFQTRFLFTFSRILVLEPLTSVPIQIISNTRTRALKDVGLQDQVYYCKVRAWIFSDDLRRDLNDLKTRAWSINFYFDHLRLPAIRLKDCFK